MSCNDLITNETLDNCPICLDKINHTNRIITSCGHHFHASCLINNVLLSRNTCPCCRQPIMDNRSEEDTSSEDYGGLADMVNRQHIFDVILDDIIRVFRHRFITFREHMYTHNSNNVASYLTRNVSFQMFEDVYVSTIRNNLMEIRNNTYFKINNCELISTFVRYKTEVMCEKYWVQMHSQYRYNCYIDVFKGLLTGGCVMGLLIISLKPNILQ